jgi:3-methylfumaryl-CoA hydratase
MEASMDDVDIEHLKTWIGRQRTVEDLITPRLAMSLDAVLDEDGARAEGEPAPVGIHWCLAPDIVPMRGIGPDGHPARGGFLPPVPFPRRMWAGGELAFSGDFRIGDKVARHSTIEDVVLKSGRSGAMVFVTVRHRYETVRGVVLSERQDIVYRKAEASGSAPLPTARQDEGEDKCIIVADPVLLFRYSAITFNGHRIHYDQPYTTSVEQYPGLIFHGPLQATLLLKLAADRRNGALPARFAFRSVHPLFAGGRVHCHARSQEDGLELWLTNDAGIMTMQAKA